MPTPRDVSPQVSELEGKIAELAWERRRLARDRPGANTKDYQNVEKRIDELLVQRKIAVLGDEHFNLARQRDRSGFHTKEFLELERNIDDLLIEQKKWQDELNGLQKGKASHKSSGEDQIRQQIAHLQLFIDERKHRLFYCTFNGHLREERYLKDAIHKLKQDKETLEARLTTRGN